MSIAAEALPRGCQGRTGLEEGGPSRLFVEVLLGNLHIQSMVGKLSEALPGSPVNVLDRAYEKV